MPKKTRVPKRKITAEDLLQFHIVATPMAAPSGDRIVFVKKQANAKNEYASNLWMVGTDGKPPRQFTFGDKDRSPQWSNDGGQIAFVSARVKGHPQIYTIDVDGGEARPLTTFPEGDIGAFRWAPDGRSIAVAYREQDPALTADSKKKREECGGSPPPRITEDLWYRMDGDGYFGDRRFKLYLVDVATGEHRMIYGKDTLGTFSFDFRPDSKELIVSTNQDSNALTTPWKDALIRINLSTGKVTPLRGLPRGPKTSVRWSPDGKTIAYAGREGRDGTYSVENLGLWTCTPLGGGAKDLLSDEDYCLLAVTVSDTTEVEFEPNFSFNSDSSKIFFALGHEGVMRIASIPTRGGSVKIHTPADQEVHLGNVATESSRVAVTFCSPTRLAEVGFADYRRKTFDIRTATDFNGDLLEQIELSTPVEGWIEGEDGNRNQYWVLKPAHLKRGAKAPAVLEIHGGPHAQYGIGFFHEFQVLAAAGYVVYFSNPRGSKGYGRDHCAAIHGRWGTADWEDIQALTRHIASEPFVDRKRIGIMGGSYGGYMTNWAIGHSNAYKAAITDRCVSNLVSMSGSSDFPIEPDVYFPGNFWDRPEQRWEQSPIAFFGNAKTPTLVIHSEGDLRCNVEQGEQVFTALKLQGIPSRFVRYPTTTSHGMSRNGPPDLRIHRLHEILSWWERYLAIG